MSKRLTTAGLQRIIQRWDDGGGVTAGLQRIIQRWDDGGGVTAAVQAFAQAVPVAERTVWYWLGGRQIHPAMQARIRSLKLPKKRNRKEHP